MLMVRHLTFFLAVFWLLAALALSQTARSQDFPYPISTSQSGIGTAATPAPVLKLSSAPLDSELRKDIDGLPRRVNDQFQNPGDMVNFVIVGSQKTVQDALD